jgi:AraC family ethanolamine operon transcriptional activator
MHNLTIQKAELHDVDEQADMLSGWQQEYRQLGRGRFCGMLSIADAGDFRLLRERTNQVLHESVMPPADQLVVGMRLNCGNTENLLIDGREFDQNAFMVIDGRRAYDFRTRGALDLCGIAVKKDFLYARMHEQDALCMDTLLQRTTTTLAEPAANMLRQYFTAIGELLQGDGQNAQSEVSARMIASSLISNLTLAVALGQHARAEDALPRHKQRRDRIVQQAIDYMRSNADRDIDILDVCAAAGVSRRTLQYCFEERLEISPLQYLKALRLNRARRQLKRDQRHSVADIASLCGFDHPSRFSSDYRRMFGELPSQTRG